MKRFWLLKTEPKEFSWSEMLKSEVTPWDGVRNYQAISNMKRMRCGDQAFFYHTGTNKCIKGVVIVCQEFYTQASEKFGVVDVQMHFSLRHAVYLSEIRSHPLLCNMTIIKHPRLSVSPVTEPEWETILDISQNKQI